MRIDTSSLIAAQSAPRPTQAAPKPAQAGGPINPGAGMPPADKPLFEALIFREASVETAPSRPQGTRPQTPLKRPGALIDITV